MTIIHKKVATLPDQPGIYRILNTVSGKLYVGSARNIRQRWNEHKSSLSRGLHKNRKLQNSWNFHGPSVFDLSPIVFCSEMNLALYEQLCIVAFDVVETGHNIAPTAQSNFGVRHTEKSKENFRRGAVGRKMPPMSAEARLAKSFAAKGRKMPPMSEETKRKISLSLTGIIRGPASEPHRMKLRLAKLGRKLSEAHKEKISLAMTEFWSSNGN